MVFMVALALVLPAAVSFAADYDGFLPLLIDLPGWKAEPAEGADASAAGMKAVSANRTYENGERKIEASILVGIQAGAAWTPGNQEGYKMETPEGLMEVKKINGFMVSYIYEKASKSGGIVVLLRYDESKPDSGAVFAINFEGLTLDEAMKMAQRFSWQKMKDQAARLK